MELWKSNGTKAGTVLVKNMNPVQPTTTTTARRTLTAVGREVVLLRRPTTTPTARSCGRRTAPIAAPSWSRTSTHAASYGGSYPSSLTAVWAGRCSSPPTTAPTAGSCGSRTAPKRGTVLVKDINPGDDSQHSLLPDRGGRDAVLHRPGRRPRPGAVEVGRQRIGHRPGQGHQSRCHGSSPSSLTAVGGTLFFTADDGIHGQELWTSNGSGSGTVLVKDIRSCSGQLPGAHLPDAGGETVVLRRQRRHPRPGAVEVERHQGRHRPGQGHQPRPPPLRGRLNASPPRLTCRNVW